MTKAVTGEGDIRDDESWIFDTLRSSRSIPSHRFSMFSGIGSGVEGLIAEARSASTSAETIADGDDASAAAVMMMSEEGITTGRRDSSSGGGGDSHGGDSTASSEMGVLKDAKVELELARDMLVEDTIIEGYMLARPVGLVWQTDMEEDEDEDEDQFGSQRLGGRAGTSTDFDDHEESMLTVKSLHTQEIQGLEVPPDVSQEGDAKVFDF